MTQLQFAGQLLHSRTCNVFLQLGVSGFRSRVRRATPIVCPSGRLYSTVRFVNEATKVTSYFE